mmetsp:Transcript_1207/g.3999  ORF Transcript_1207/g.3999 Transcript_1207/m.3999 type:complete len:219 (-) Transcript_1207:807-1463(-)
MPRPGSLILFPLWIPSFSFTGDKPSTVSTFTSAPSAATCMGTEKRVWRSAPSRSNRGSPCTSNSTFRLPGGRPSGPGAPSPSMFICIPVSTPAGTEMSMARVPTLRPFASMLGMCTVFLHPLTASRKESVICTRMSRPRRGRPADRMNSLRMSKGSPPPPPKPPPKGPKPSKPSKPLNPPPPPPPPPCRATACRSPPQSRYLPASRLASPPPRRGTPY